MTVPAVEDIDMATNAEERIFAPTNKENAFGGMRANFLTAENLVQPEFGPKKIIKKQMVDDLTAPPTVREDGHPSPACRKLLPPLLEAVVSRLVIYRTNVLMYRMIILLARPTKVRR